MSGVLQESFIQSLPSNRYYRTNFETEADYYSHFEENKSEECNEQCRNLYYWLGNKLLLNKLGENSFPEVIEILKDVSNVLRERGKCKCDFFKNINTKNFEKMKIVHDYCKDHESIKHTLEAHKNTCNNKFSEYLVKAASIYDEVYKCAVDNSETYCTELKEYIPSCFNEKLSRLKCEIKEVSAQGKGLSQYGTNYFDPTYFTPVMSWIHTKVLKKISTRRNLDDMDTLKLTEYTSEQGKSNLARRQLNVAYHTASTIF
ncbi:hypothetical protein MKS88_004010 [Plasmodium brasilianum]|uniref:Uncharacterized protein n=1 Tax=Plasmodium brasilianum TaxID=5824 RepID=A0ACB9Y463_PLABR|nr:hypothetical protein MKS88_004010 [Plasmodium brasilianum]